MDEQRGLWLGLHLEKCADNKAETGPPIELSVDQSTLYNLTALIHFSTDSNFNF
jgi:hypothetical protein